MGGKEGEKERGGERLYRAVISLIIGRPVVTHSLGKCGIMWKKVRRNTPECVIFWIVSSQVRFSIYNSINFEPRHTRTPLVTQWEWATSPVPSQLPPCLNAVTPVSPNIFLSLFASDFYWPWDLPTPSPYEHHLSSGPKFFVAAQNLDQLCGHELIMSFCGAYIVTTRPRVPAAVASTLPW